MTMSLEGSFLARRRGERGEGESKRVAERVNAFDDEMLRDAESFPEIEDDELKNIRVEATALVDKTRKSLVLKVKQWAQKSSFVKMAAVAGTSVGIHAALLSHPMEDGELKRKWAEEGAVIRLQSKEEQKAVQQKVEEREARIDRTALAEYKTEMSQKIERGEPVTFEDLYFSLEEKNGVLPEDVVEARQGARKMIDEFSADVGDELSEGEIKDMVEEMYGEKDNYDAGQASVTEYFKAYNQGKKPKRNCVTIDRAEQIVFEGVIARLREEERAKFSIGEMAVKQHKIATLTWRDGSEERLFPLEPNQPERTIQPEAGIAKVDASFLKTAAVADRSVRVNAGKGDVPPSPDIEATTNEPFSSGYAVDGPLIASDFVRAEVERKGIQVENRKDDVMELEIENPLEQTAQLQQEMLDRGFLPVWKITNPSPEIIQELNSPIPQGGAFGIELGEMKGWTHDQIRGILDATPYKYQLNFASGISEELRSVLAIKQPRVSGGPSPVYLFDTVTFSPRPESGYALNELSTHDVEVMLQAFPKSEIRFHAQFTFGMLGLQQETFKAMKRAHVKKFYFDATPGVEAAERVLSEGEIWKEMAAFASPVEMNARAYFAEVGAHPEYWEYANISPSLEGEAYAVLLSIRPELQFEQPTPHQVEVMTAMDKIIGERKRFFPGE